MMIENKQVTRAGIIILCRYSSRRLPGKILMKIGERTILQRIYDRLCQQIDPSLIVVATSDDTSDDLIENYCQQQGIQCFRGDLNDVAGRFLAAAQAFNFDYAVRINGDNLFVDLVTLAEMMALATTNTYDFVTNVEGRTFPYGMSIEVVRVSFYTSLYQQLDSADYKEHVTLFLYHHPQVGQRFNFYNKKYPEAQGQQLAVDTPADFDRASAIIDLLNDAPDYTLKEISAAIQQL